MRGTVIGEKVQTRAQTRAWDEGCAEAGIDAPKGERGVFVWDDAQGKLVRAEDYQPPERALDAPIMCDRFLEGATYDNGERIVDIGSRKKRKAFMRENNLADYDDFSPAWREKTRRDIEKGHDQERRESLERSFRAHHNRRK